MSAWLDKVESPLAPSRRIATSRAVSYTHLILRSLEGALLGASGQLGNNPHFEVAAKAIGAAVVLDGLDLSLIHI